MGVVILAIYGLFALVALSNLILMRRPKPIGSSDEFCALIPARNEEANLAELIPQLKNQLPVPPKIYVYDDESTDQTSKVAQENGAILLRAMESLPAGWTGKNRACHELAKAATEDSNAKWFLFLDADVRVDSDFLQRLSNLAKQAGPRVGVLTGFGKMLPGRGSEPLALAWVGWILLATNPFGIVSRTRLGHNGFTNGQIHAWRSDVYSRLWPNQLVKGRLLEDVAMGRLCAKEKVRIEVANLSAGMRVRMYDTWREAVNGMSKNSYEIAGNTWGTIGIAAFFLTLSVLWVFAGPNLLWALLLFTVSGLSVAATVRGTIWPALLMPGVCLVGSATILRSLVWKRKGRTTWKGRTYS
ncbi:MAG TPA: glycosyltransferase family 2 protein [Fimbriimonadaceae bacterium]|nr:glycosyltransferase family 2 protein [Fimbriimonadaceae bacterium]